MKVLLGLLLILIGCEPIASPAWPPVIASERFQVTTRVGNAIPAEEYETFYRQMVESVGAARADLTLSISLGDLGTTVTVVVVRGKTAAALLPPMLSAAFGSDGSLKPEVLAGYVVTRIRGRPGTIAFVKEPALYIIDVTDPQRLPALLAALEEGP